VQSAGEAVLAVVGWFLILTSGIYAAGKYQQWLRKKSLPPGKSDDKLPPGGNDDD